LKDDSEPYISKRILTEYNQKLKISELQKKNQQDNVRNTRPKASELQTKLEKDYPYRQKSISHMQFKDQPEQPSLLQQRDEWQKSVSDHP
jgi:hypothetical protein